MKRLWRQGTCQPASSRSPRRSAPVRTAPFRSAALALAVLALLSSPGRAQAPAVDGRKEAPPRPADVEALKAYDVLDRHCARCHQAGRLEQRAKPAAEIGNILRVDEMARDAHFVRPGLADASRLYTLMLGRRMPYDVYHEGANREPPNADDIDVVRSWIGGLQPKVRSCPGRAPVSNDALQIAIARDVERMPPAHRLRVRYLSLTSLWSACAPDDFLASARSAAHVLLSGLSRGMRPVHALPIDAAKTILRVDLSDLKWDVADWDRLAGLSPYVQPSAFATTARGPSVSSAVLAASQPIRLDWLAFILSEETRKRVQQTPALSAGVTAMMEKVWSGPDGLSQLRGADPAAFRAALAAVGLDPAPLYDQSEMIDLLARRYTRDLGPQEAAAEIGMDLAALHERLEAGPAESQHLLLRLIQGGISRPAFEAAFASTVAYLLAQDFAAQRDILGLGTLGRPPARAVLPFDIEMVAAKPRYVRDETVRLIVRSEADCHLTLVSIAPSGRAVVLLPNDWDRSTFLPAGKEQSFPRDDSPFRLRLDTAGTETIVAGCNPSGTVFDGIVHDFNLEKFTSLGDYRRFLMRVSEGIPMSAPPTPQGERRATQRRPPRSGRGDSELDKPDPASRTAIRIDVREPETQARSGGGASGTAR